jgi:hypothetical protein
MTETPRYRRNLSLFWFVTALCLAHLGWAVGHSHNPAPLQLTLDSRAGRAVTGQFRADGDAKYLLCLTDGPEAGAIHGRHYRMLSPDAPPPRVEVRIIADGRRVAVRDKGGACLRISSAFGSFDAEKGKTYTVTAWFAEPPADPRGKTPRLEVGLGYWQHMYPRMSGGMVLLAGMACAAVGIYHGAVAVWMFRRRWR